MGPDQTADARTRRLSLVVIACTTVIGVLTILAFERYRPALEAWLRSDPATTVPLTLGLLILLGPVPMAVFACYLWRIGGRTIESTRFPPPGLRRVRAEPLLVGERAVRRGRIAQGLALLLGAAAAGLAFTLWRLASLFGDARP